MAAPEWTHGAALTSLQNACLKGSPECRCAHQASPSAVPIHILPTAAPPTLRRLAGCCSCRPTFACSALVSMSSGKLKSPADCCRAACPDPEGPRDSGGGSSCSRSLSTSSKSSVPCAEPKQPLRLPAPPGPHGQLSQGQSSLCTLLGWLCHNRTEEVPTGLHCNCTPWRLIHGTGCFSLTKCLYHSPLCLS